MKGTTATAPYISLPMGEEYILFAEDNEGTIPVDLSKGELRDYSPFILSVEAPKLNYGLRSLGNNRPFGSPLEVSRFAPRERNRGTIAPVISTRSAAPIAGGDGAVGLNGEVQAGVADRDNLIDVAQQMSHLDNRVPPIVFIINPSSFTQEYSHIQAFQEMSRYGFIYQRWGEDLSKISITCKVGAFIAGRQNRGDTSGVTGLQFAAKRDSAGWRNLMAIFSVYRNSVAIGDRLGRSRANHAVGRQVIHYDGQKWVGRIDSFSFGYDENQQNGGFEFSMDFTVYQHFYEDFDFKTEDLEALISPS